MAPKLPGPDRPRGNARWKVKPKGFKTVRAGNGFYVLPKNAGAGKPAGPKPTSGNKYTPGPTPSGNRPPSAGAGSVAAPKPPPDPYADYKQYPWAYNQLTELDRTEAAHKQYASGVADWLSGGLRGLTGIDPNAPGYNPSVQQQYMANVAGQVGGALNAAAIATPMQASATTPGGVVQGSNAYLGEAARTASAQRSSAAIQMSQAQSALNTMQPNTFAQGAMRAFADMQAGLPALYAQKRNDLRTKIDQFIQTSEETARHNRVTEAISAQNAQTNAAIAFANLGLKADDQAFGQNQDLTEAAQDQAAASAPAPYGYQRDPATGRLVRDPSVPQASASGGGSGGGGNKPLTASQISSMNGKWKRPKSSPPKLGPGWKQPVWDPGTKTWYAKRAAGAGTGTKTKKVRSTFNLSEDLIQQWRPSSGDGIEYRYDNDPVGGGRWIASWVRENKSDFVKSGRIVDIGKLNQVLGKIGGRPMKEARRVLNGYMRVVNGKLVWK